MRALILVDIQNDFMPAGALPAADGFEVIAVANGLTPNFDLVVATQDWHPPNHGSFASNQAGHDPGDVIDLDGLEQVLWPDHCVQGTAGAAFVETLEMNSVDAIVRKGTDPCIDSYSGFFDNGHRKSTGLTGYLRERDVEEVFIVGVATDYCVKWTALDAVKAGFDTFVVRDGCRGVGLQPEDIENAFTEMTEAGVELIHSSDIEARP